MHSCNTLLHTFDDLKEEEKETSQSSLAYEVLSAHNTKKLMNVEDVNDLAWLVISSYNQAVWCMCAFELLFHHIPCFGVC